MRRLQNFETFKTTPFTEIDLLYHLLLERSYWDSGNTERVSSRRAFSTLGTTTLGYHNRDAGSKGCWTNGPIRPPISSPIVVW
jgi:hypothetical protein